MAIRWSKVNNKFGEWNLPPDYESLTSDGKRAARLNAVACRETPSDMITAWNFTRQYYFTHDESYFYKEYCPSPPMHYDIVSCFRHPKREHAIAAPRGYSKSTIAGLEVPLIEILSPSVKGMEIGLVLAKDDMVEERFDKIMVQLEENSRILEDFGRLRPDVGGGVWNRHYLRLRNRVTVWGVSVDGKKRGKRPDLVVVDDPEQDPKTNTDKEITMADMDNMCIRQLLGMLMPSSRLLWVGTLLHQKSYLHHILTCTPEQDPRFKSWNKLRYGECPNPETEKDLSKYLWPERFTPEYLAHKKETMGVGGYLTEYCNTPRSDVDNILTIDPTLNEYWFEEESPHYMEAPLTYKGKMVTYDCGVDKDKVIVPQEEKVQFNSAVNAMTRFITVDYATSFGATADYSAIAVIGHDTKRNTIYALDCWHGKVRPGELIRQIWEFGQKWRVHVVGIEAVGIQRDIQQQVADAFDALADKTEWLPKVVPIVYPQKVSKADRIASLEWRFRKGRIKLPRDVQNAHWNALRDQIENFTMDLSRLPHDDLVDALAMFHSMVKGAARVVDVPMKAMTLQDRIADGQLTFPEHSGITTLSGLMSSELTPEVIDNLIKARGEEEESDVEYPGAPDYSESEILW